MENQTPSSEGKTKNITFGLVLAWGFSVLVGLSAIALVFSEPLAGIALLLAALVVFPPMSKVIAEKMHIKLSGGLKALIAVILLVVGGTLSGTGNSATGTVSDSGNTSTTTTSSTKSAVVEIVDVSTRVTESNSVWSKYAWNLTLKNNTDRDRTVGATIKWTDKDGFVVDTDYEYSLTVPANSEKTFNDFTLIDASVAGNVEGIQAEIR